MKKVIERVPRGDGANVDELVHYVGPDYLAEAIHKALNDEAGIRDFWARQQKYDIEDL